MSEFEEANRAFIDAYEHEDWYKHSTVYFFQEGLTGNIKVGWTVSLRARWLALRAANANEIRVIGLMRGLWDHEQAIHAKFAHIRHHGEWFKPDPSLVLFIMVNAACTPDELREKFEYSPFLRECVVPAPKKERKRRTSANPFGLRFKSGLK